MVNIENKERYLHVTYSINGMMGSHHITEIENITFNGCVFIKLYIFEQLIKINESIDNIQQQINKIEYTFNNSSKEQNLAAYWFLNKKKMYNHKEF